jgi:hypothetical protein
MPKRLNSAHLALAGLIMLALAACAPTNIGDNLSRAIMNQDDPETVREGAPSYLLLVDSLIENDPTDIPMLITGTKLNAAYAGLLVQSPKRAVLMATKAQGYGQRALCLGNKQACDIAKLPYDRFTTALEELRKRDVPALHAFALAWLVRVQAGGGDWCGLAELPKIEAVLERIVTLDQHFGNGSPQLYLGVLNSLRPMSLGGNPEKGRGYFEQAILLSKGENLAAKVAYARSYARLVYNQDLHDRLLNEVLEAQPRIQGLTLINVLAQREARLLLKTSADYF